MNKKAFTLIEIAVVCLIVSILFHGMFKLLQLALNRFSYHESHISMTWEAGRLCSYLHQDFEDAFIPDITQTGLSSVNFSEDSFSLPHGSSNTVYKFDKTAGQVQRITSEKTADIGKGLIKEFSAVPEVQYSNGEIKPFATIADNDEPNVVPQRIWVKIHLLLEPQTQKQPKTLQEFNFYAFPVRLNRQLQSIWKPE
ncbi:MAG: hypothetical protein CVV42_10420 [Candidatus Riflebacteria bacterium HGW-Riflebacteria-2]|jgi:hypothetical protein|nr:MAG: hypothetical protein CVV42_10420 [Candidatus Riflebacteria bacterium HGW-Riflebacteria-2]